MNRILIFRGGAVGDFVVTLPVLAALRRQWPEARIALASYPRVKRLALQTGLADEFHSLDGPEMARLFAGEENHGCRGSPPAANRQPGLDHDGTRTGTLHGHRRDRRFDLPSFDLVLSYLHDPDGRVRANLERGGAQRLIGSTPLPASGHVVDHLLAPLKELGIPLSGNEMPRLKTDRPEGLTTPVTGSCYSLHPGSGSPKKNWPADKFAELARRIREEGIGSPFFTLGEADDNVGERLACLAPDVPVIRDLDLVDLAGWLANCRCYVGNDSGITHLAAAVGIPVVALFGPTDPTVWGPRGSHVRIIRALESSTESLARIDVGGILDSLARQ